MWRGDRGNEHGELDWLEPKVSDALPVNPHNPPVQEPKQTGSASRSRPAGVMVALFPHPEVAEELAVRGGSPPDDLHITLVYLGDVADRTPAGVILGASTDRIVAAATTAAAMQPPLSGTIGGIGTFPANGDGVPVWAPVDVPGLSALREALVEALDEQGAPTRSHHGFTPHMTLGFNLDLALIPPVNDVAVTFDHLVVAVGGARSTVRFGGRLDTPEQQMEAHGYDPAVEVGADAGHRPPVRSKVKSYPRLAGTMEDQQERLWVATPTTSTASSGSHPTVDSENHRTVGQMQRPG
jgi:2'-5' RNA ligase